MPVEIDGNGFVSGLSTPTSADQASPKSFVETSVEASDSFSELSDIDLSSLSDGDVIVYNSSTSKFENRPPEVPATAPVGSIIWHGGNSAPSNYLKADGSLVSRSTYSALFSAIGTSFGEGDGSTTFALPDLRGEFVRGFDDGRGVDSGRSFGSSQADASLHVDRTQRTGDNSSAAGGSIPTDGTFGAEVATSNDFGATPWGGGGGGIAFAMNNSETRPRNVAMLACIKYQ